MACVNSVAKMFPGKHYVLGEPMLNDTREDSVLYWIHVLSLQGMPRNVEDSSNGREGAVGCS